MTNKIYLAVYDEKTKLLKSSRVMPFNTFNMNFMTYIMRALGGEFTTAGTTDNDGNLEPKPPMHGLASTNIYGDKSTSGQIDSISPLANTENYMAPFDATLGDESLMANTISAHPYSGKGIVVGTNDIDFAFTQHELQGYQRHGVDSGELFRHLYIVRYDFTDAANPLVRMERLFINKTEETITIHEVGIHADNLAGDSFSDPPSPSQSYNQESFLIARDKIPAPAETVEPGDVLRVTYEFTLSGWWKPPMLNKMIEWVSGSGSFKVYNILDSLTDGALNFNTITDFGVDDNGVVVGASNVVAHQILPDQTGPGLNTLEDRIDHGGLDGQLLYGDSVVHELEEGTDEAWVDVERSFYNYSESGTGPAVEVKEVGLYVGTGGNKVMLFRKPLAEAVLIGPNEGKVFTIRVKVNI